MNAIDQKAAFDFSRKDLERFFQDLGGGKLSKVFIQKPPNSILIKSQPVILSWSLLDFKTSYNLAIKSLKTQKEAIERAKGRELQCIDLIFADECQSYAHDTLGHFEAIFILKPIKRTLLRSLLHKAMAYASKNQDGL